MYHGDKLHGACDRLGGGLEKLSLDLYVHCFDGLYMCANRFNYGAPDLRSSMPGAMVRAESGFQMIPDPFWAPLVSVKALTAPVGIQTDKLKVALLRAKLGKKILDDIFAGKEQKADGYFLKKKGFSQQMVERFFRPFYQDIFLTDLGSLRISRQNISVSFPNVCVCANLASLSWNRSSPGPDCSV